MKRQKIYLDTSVINHLDAPDTPDKMNDTIAFWKRLIDNPPCDIVISEVFLKEIVDCPEPKRSFMFEQLSSIHYELVSRTPEVTQLAEQYIEFGVLSRKHYNDLLHIAHAAIYDCHVVLSWNFRHFVNFKTIDRVNAVHLVMGYHPIKIASPSMILGEFADE